MQKLLLQALQCGLESPRSNSTVTQLDVADIPLLGVALQAITQAL